MADRRAQAAPQGRHRVRCCCGRCSARCWCAGVVLLARRCNSAIGIRRLHRRRPASPAATVKLPGSRRSSSLNHRTCAPAPMPDVQAGGGARPGPDSAGGAGAQDQGVRDPSRVDQAEGAAGIASDPRSRGPGEAASDRPAPGADAGVAGVGLGGRLRARGPHRRLRQPAPGRSSAGGRSSADIPACGA